LSSSGNSTAIPFTQGHVKSPVVSSPFSRFPVFLYLLFLIKSILIINMARTKNLPKLMAAVAIMLAVLALAAGCGSGEGDGAGRQVSEGLPVAENMRKAVADRCAGRTDTDFCRDAYDSIAKWQDGVISDEEFIDRIADWRNDDSPEPPTAPGSGENPSPGEDGEPESVACPDAGPGHVSGKLLNRPDGLVLHWQFWQFLKDGNLEETYVKQLFDENGCFSLDLAPYENTVEIREKTLRLLDKNTLIGPDKADVFMAPCYVGDIDWRDDPEIYWPCRNNPDPGDDETPREGPEETKEITFNEEGDELTIHFHEYGDMNLNNASVPDGDAFEVDELCRWNLPEQIYEGPSEGIGIEDVLVSRNSVTLYLEESRYRQDISTRGRHREHTVMVEYSVPAVNPLVHVNGARVPGFWKYNNPFRCGSSGGGTSPDPQAPGSGR